MRALDLFCGAGGVSVGLDRAGFEVLGVDNQEQPSYPYQIVYEDAVEFLNDALDIPEPVTILNRFDFIWASPPCQAYSWSAKRWKNGTRGQKKRKYPDLISPIRKLLENTGRPWIIENVAGAPIRHDAMLCGNMFGLGVNRHRYFESNIPLVSPKHINCAGRIARGEAFTVAGHGGNSKSFKLEDWQDAMGIDWMNMREHNLGSKENPGNREDLCEAIPPAYAEYLGHQVVEHLKQQRRAKK